MSAEDVCARRYFGERIMKKRKTEGFSLIEVSIAMLVAGGGMLALFGMFPVGLRQSAMGKADMYQATFADSVLTAISENIKLIDKLDDWEDKDGNNEKSIEKFWEYAVGNKGGIKTGLNGKLRTIDEMHSELGGKNGLYDAIFKTDKDDASPVDNKAIMYIYDDDAASASSAKVKILPQYMIRILRIPVKGVHTTSSDGTGTWPGFVNPNPKNNPMYGGEYMDDSTDMPFPCKYVVTLVASDQSRPSLFVENATYQIECYFTRRP